MQGTRLPAADDTNVPEMAPGAYRKLPSGNWVMMAPNGKDWGTINTTIWSVVEHEDGAITVKPSIWFNKPSGWHGFLEKGVWRTA